MEVSMLAKRNTRFSFLLMIVVLSSILSLVPIYNSHANEVTIEYDGFELLFDCDRRGALQFEYKAKKDTGNLPRKSSFTTDKETEAISENCQQISTKSYKHPDFSYDRGHLVPANHLDHLKKGIVQSNNMTNILPQARTMNRGAWKLTEEIIECHRDIEPLRVIGGVVWGYNPDDDYFVESHGVETPDYFWKVVIADDKAISWLIPNSHGATRKRLDLYLTTVKEIEEFIGKKINVPAKFKNTKPTQSWKLSKNCNKG